MLELRFEDFKRKGSSYALFKLKRVDTFIKNKLFIMLKIKNIKSLNTYEMKTVNGGNNGHHMPPEEDKDKDDSIIKIITVLY